MSKTTRFLPILLPALFAVGIWSASAAPAVSSPTGEERTVIFRFVAGDDMFYIPLEGNGSGLDSLVQTVQQHMEHLRAGRMYISVSSYDATGNASVPANRIGYLRNSRVKSELIVRTGVTEAMFVTDRVIREPYAESGLRDVVVVTLPASENKVLELAGAEAAARVAAFNKELSAEAALQAQRAESERIAAEQATRERIAAERAAREKADAERLAAERRERERAEAERLATERAEAERQVAEAAAEAKPYCFAFRTNVLYDAMLLPTLGVEWRVNRHLGIKVDGSRAWWGDEHGKRQNLWLVNPEVRWYLLRDKRFYVGVSGNFGEANIYKYPFGSIISSDTGYQGSFWGAGATVGYQLYLSRHFSIDFNVGLGYTRFEFDSFGITDGVRVYKDRDCTKNFWGPTQAGISLIWTIGGRK